MAETANRSRGSGRRVRGAFAPEARCDGLFAISWATPAAYGGSQARGPIGAVATGLRQSHSNAGSELRLQPKDDVDVGRIRKDLALL